MNLLFRTRFNQLSICQNLSDQTKRTINKLQQWNEMRKFKKLSTDQMWDEIVQMNERIKDDYLKYEEKIHKEFEEWFAKNSPRIK